MSLLIAVAAVTVTVGISPAQSATLSAVPMQGGMVMPMISYHAEHGHLHVMMPSEIPQLTPLLVSNPGDAFDPADPWYDALDPRRQGLAFSRRYGFVMGTESDPLPEGTAIWIRKLSGPADLAFYSYSASAPKQWQPIFGTGGAPSARAWNGMMFHPTVTAPAGAQGYTASFEAYLVNQATGQEVEHSASGPFAFVFTNAPDGRPALEIALQVVIAWPADAGSHVLEYAETLPASEWVTVTDTPVTIRGKPSVVLEAGAATRFFRLRPAP